LDSPAQARRQDLFELGQRTDGRLLDADHTAPGGGAQAHRDRDGFFVVQQQRGQLGARFEPVTTVGP
jgi:hypothetical protein